MQLFSSQYSTPHHAYPFPLITTADIRAAILKGMEEDDKEVEAIAASKEAPTFANTIEALENTGALLDRATTLMYNKLSAETSDELEALAEEMSPLLTAHSAAIMQNERLFARVKVVRDTAQGLNDEEQMLLDNTYEGFERSGATLDKAGKERFKEISTEIAQLTLQFSQNNLKETNAYELWLTSPEQLKGLPALQVEQAAAAAKEKGREGWLITLHAPSYVPFLSYADDRELRRQLYVAYNTKCTHDNEQNNFQIVSRLVNLRREKAQLLGYDTYADYVLRHRMAGNVEAVNTMLRQLIDAYLPAAKQEVEDVRQLAKQLQGDNFELQPWDFSYYARLLKKQRFDLDPDELRPYFELSAVIDGVFGLATRLYGINFLENKDVPVYHPDVHAYDILDADGSFLALLYADFHPRATKKGGAWMTNYKEEQNYTDRPHVSVTMNLTKPTADKPALLTLDEVETFLHEFGHALHGIFANTLYRSLSGTNVYWDFVELPSQFMENFAVQPEFLRTFARHYETGEVIPDELISRIVASRNFNAAYACMRQVSFGLLDMAYYTLREPFTADVREFERQAWREVQLLPALPEACMTVQFSHIMSGGYAAGYYSYKWAEILDADAFQCFKEHGIFSTETASRFRRSLLSQGGTRPPMELYKDFRGQAPSIDALLERDGIKNSTI